MPPSPYSRIFKVTPVEFNEFAGQVQRLQAVDPEKDNWFVVQLGSTKPIKYFAIDNAVESVKSFRELKALLFD